MIFNKLVYLFLSLLFIVFFISCNDTKKSNLKIKKTETILIQNNSLEYEKWLRSIFNCENESEKLCFPDENNVCTATTRIPSRGCSFYYKFS